jgi:serine protease Do
MSVSRSPWRAVSVLIASVALSACLGDTSNAQQSAAPAATAPPARAVPTAPPPAVSGRVLPDFVPLVDRYGPAVVNVSVVQKVETTSNDQPPGISPDDPFYEFFRRFGIPGPNMGPRGQQPPVRGEGSGFIVTPDGYVLTNAHVVGNGGEVTVRLTDRREFVAKVVGADTRTDVAVLKIDARNLPTVTVGKPADLRPGEWVIAIGSPFGFENSVTAGIVSATSRSLPSDNYVPFIQTDVAVNPGNSGGPLFNMRGEVVGINSQIYSQTGGYMGLSFAIPIDVAMNVQEQLIRTGRVVRGRIGVTVQPVNAQLAESFGLDRPRGALVSSVEPEGPSEKAGLKPGDVILDVNGAAVDSSSQLPNMIASMKPGTQARLGVWRNGKRNDMGVRIAELEEQGQRAASRPASRQADQAAQFGLAVRPLAQEEKQQMETDGNLVVEDVSGPAASAGVQPGDIILGVNGARVKSVAELQAAAKKSGKTVALLIQREDAQIFVPVRIG